MDNIRQQAAFATAEVIEKSGIKAGQIFVVGCSTSAVLGSWLGKASSPEVAKEIFSGIYDELNKHGIYLAAQCCEHLNRAIIIERAAAGTEEIVCVVPQPNAGGSFATTAYNAFSDPVVIEQVKADAGMDIGGTLIGMHLKRVAVPIAMTNNKIGEAHITAARTRPKYIGGERAVYELPKK